ncbi:hypothetical protein MMC22_006569 [Lobaria immixta]|nr:hypothetical protein [Lobaria immixta]
MADRPLDSNQCQPYLLRGALEPAPERDFLWVSSQVDADPDVSESPEVYPCLFPHCESNFQNTKDLDHHYKRVHRIFNDELGFEGAPLANAVFSTTGESSQPRLSFSPDANLAIGASLHGLFLGHVDHNDSTGDAFGMHQSPSSLSLVNDFSINKPHLDALSVVVGDQLDVAALMWVVPIDLSFRPDANLGNVNKDDGRLSAHNASFGDAFGMHQSSQSLSLVDDFSIHEPHSNAPSAVLRDQLDAAALVPFVPIAAASTTSISQPVSLGGGDQLNTSAVLPSVPVEATYTTVSPPTLLHASSISSPAPPPQTAATGALSRPRYVCPTCSKTYSRVLDMQRHAKKHDPSAQRIDCPSPGCPYTE